jgi:hypothetical protein
MNSKAQQMAEPSEKTEQPFTPKIKKPVRLWLLAFALGWMFDFLFWGRSTGVNFAIFSVLSVAGGLIFLSVEGYRPSRNSLWLLLPVAFFVIVSFLRQEPLTSFLAYAFTFFSVGVFVATYLGGRWLQYGLLDYFGSFFQIIGSMFVRQWDFLLHVSKEREASGGMARKFPLAAVLRGLLIALPIVVVFAMLLASADAVFNQKIIDFFEFFDAGKIAEYFVRLLIILACAHALAGIFLHAASGSRDEKLIGENAPVVKQFLGFTESSVVLGSVGLLFLLFVIIQFQYFFGGQSNIGVAGYTYSQYARRGFNELVTVAFCSLLLIMSLSTITRRETELQRKIYSWLSVTIVLQVLVILTSAYQRLTLAIDWHGFSRLRLYPRVFLIWVGILFVVVVLLEIFRQEKYFAFAFVMASLGFAVSLTLVNVDEAIVKRNIFRVSQGKNLNVGHLASLSADAVPSLVDAYRSANSDSTREGVGAVLLCYVYSEKVQPGKIVDWRSFNYSYWQASQQLAEVQPQLTGYRVSGLGRSLRVRTPGNVLFECQGVY